MGSLVSADPGANFYSFGNRLGGTTGLQNGVSIGQGSNTYTAPPSNGLLVYGNVGIGTTNPLAKTHFYGSRIEGDNNNLYARAFTFNGSSAFSNPSIPIWSISTGGGFQMFTLLIKVFQTSWSGNITIVSQGVAMISSNNSGATSVYTPYAGTMTVIGGNSSNVGTLSWTLTSGAMPATLYYNGVRVSNYDQYNIVAELATSGSSDGAGPGTWGTFTG